MNNYRIKWFCPLISLLLLTFFTHSPASENLAIKLKTGTLYPAPVKTRPSVITTLENRHYIIQFERPLTENDRDALSGIGITLLDYVPDFAYIATLENPVTHEIMEQHDIRWLSVFKPEYKLDPTIEETGIAEWARRGPGRAQFMLVLHRDENPQVWAEILQQEFQAEIIGREPTTNAFDVILPNTTYLEIIKRDGIMWLEQAFPYPEEHNNANRAVTGVDSVRGPPYNLDGDGIVLAMWDGGQVDVSHPDFDTRVIQMDGAIVTNHATHVAGTIIGSGLLSSGLYAGMSPGGELLTHLWWTSASELFQEYSTAVSSYDIDIGTNSWGYGVGDPATEGNCETTMGNYFAVSATIDNIVRGAAGKPVDIVWSAGNQRGSATKYCGSIGWTYNTINPLACSKNVIAVGALNANDDSMTDFSSWGPVDDGRIKPDVVAPGCQTDDDFGVTSTFPDNTYGVFCGTSMSAPTVAGLLALLRQHWANMGGTEPLLPSTVKGILINTALDLGPVGPDYQFGHGKVDGVKAVEKISAGENSFIESQLYAGDAHLFFLNVPDSCEKLKVTLVWDDPGGTVLSTAHLINDLDLVLIAPDETTYFPWVLDAENPAVPAVTGIDRINNIETAEILNPDTGTWKVRVMGFNVPEGPQKYSLIITPDSIHNVDAMSALTVRSDADITADPGTMPELVFQVINSGNVYDSVDVDIFDDAGWLLDPVDIMLYLNPGDSVAFNVTVQVPAEALANEKTFVSCQAASRTDTAVVSVRTVKITAGAVYEIHVEPTFADTTSSPANMPIDLTVENLSNAINNVYISITDEAGWVYVPTSKTTAIGPGADYNTQFTAIVPAEEAHLSTNLITVRVHGYEGEGDTVSFIVTVDNWCFPPTLITPEAISYTQNRTPNFEWDGTADSYGLYVTFDSLLTAFARIYKDIDSMNFTLPVEDSLPDGAFFWAVRKFIGDDSSSFQRYPHKITIDNQSPDSLVLIYPDQNMYINNKDFSFVMEADSTAAPPDRAPEYNLIQLSQDYSMFMINATYEEITDYQMQIPETIDDDRWYWRAQRYDLAGNYSVFSPIFSFVLDTEAPGVPTLTTPVNTAYLWDDTLIFTWQGDDPPVHEISPEYYFFHLSMNEEFSDTILGNFCYAPNLAIDSTVLTPDGEYYWRVKTLDSAGFVSAFSDSVMFRFRDYICGDVNDSGAEVDISDIVFIISYLYLGGSEPEPYWFGSVNCDTDIDISDITAIISHLYLSHDPLCCEPF